MLYSRMGYRPRQNRTSGDRSRVSIAFGYVAFISKSERVRRSKIAGGAR